MTDVESLMQMGRELKKWRGEIAVARLNQIQGLKAWEAEKKKDAAQPGRG